jgi:ankyrin repeat protein
MIVDFPEKRFFDAAHMADEDALRRCLAEGVSARSTCSGVHTSSRSVLLALLRAAKAQDPDRTLACAELLKPLSDPMAADGFGRTALAHAAASGDARLVRLFLGWSPDTADQSGSNPLHLAAEAGSPECVEILLSRFDCRAPKLRDRDALMRAAASSASHDGVERCVQLLLGRSDLGARDAEGSDALLLAAANGHAGACRALLPYFDPLRRPVSDDADSDSEGGEPAAYRAATSGDMETLGLFLPFLSRSGASASLEQALYACATADRAAQSEALAAAAAKSELRRKSSPRRDTRTIPPLFLAVDEALAAALERGRFRAANAIAPLATRKIALGLAEKHPEKMAPFLALAEAEALGEAASQARQDATAGGSGSAARPSRGSLRV